MTASTRFAPDERSVLMRQARIGPGVVETLERCGISSLAQLRSIGVEVVVEQICATAGNKAWRNRLAALRKALREPTPPTPLMHNIQHARTCPGDHA